MMGLLRAHSGEISVAACKQFGVYDVSMQKIVSN